MSTPNPFDFPVVLTAAGAQPTPPATLLAQLLARVAAINPGYTANLPGGLIEDISSTDVGALAIIDQARVALLNDLTPNGANEMLLTQLGAMLGLTLGSVTNTSVPVVFSGTVGFVIPAGFLVSDGTNVYAVQGGGPIASGGTSSPILAISVAPGSFAVPANTVTTISSSVPDTVICTVNNPSSGTPGGVGETPYSYRQRVLQANRAASVGTARYIKTLLGEAGCASNQVSVQAASPGIRAIAAGTDPYDIAYALFMSVADPSQLVGSAVNSGRNVTVNLIDYPNTYPIKYVSTQTQTVTVTVTWNTSLSTFTGGASFPSLTQQPLADYINALAPGEAINVLEMNSLFQEAISGTLDPRLLTRLVFAVYINSTLTPPGTGTYAITGDPESNFFTSAPAITVTQG